MILMMESDKNKGYNQEGTEKVPSLCHEVFNFISPGFCLFQRFGGIFISSHEYTKYLSN